MILSSDEEENVEESEAEDEEAEFEDEAVDEEIASDDDEVRNIDFVKITGNYLFVLLYRPCYMRP